MDLTITHTSNGGEHVLVLAGEIDAFTGPQLKERLLPLVNQPDVRIVAVDLTAVEYMDSTGIGIFVAAMKACRQTGCRLVVERLSPRVERLFRLTGLYERIVPRKGESDEWRNDLRPM